MQFYFHQRTADGVLEDPDGTDLPDLDAAITEALSFARQLWADAIVQQKDLIGERFEIADEMGRQVASVPMIDGLPPSLRNGVR